LRLRLIPLATILTPNIPEAELLLGHPIDGDARADAALTELLALGARAVLLKGGHLQGSTRMLDRFGDGQQSVRFAHDRLAVEGHGTGCTLAAAIAANLCLGKPLLAACEDATDYVHGALRHATRPGRGDVAVLDHFWRHRRVL
jgi:hydroxymethylpyrimidine/phosphomethylpyrimidine kinase